VPAGARRCGARTSATGPRPFHLARCSGRTRANGRVRVDSRAAVRGDREQTSGVSSQHSNEVQRLTRSGGMVERVREELRQTVREAPTTQVAATTQTIDVTTGAPAAAQQVTPGASPSNIPAPALV